MFGFGSECDRTLMRVLCREVTEYSLHLKKSTLANLWEMHDEVERMEAAIGAVRLLSYHRQEMYGVWNVNGEK